MIDWTSVVTSAVVSSIIVSGNYITTRYLGRILDRIEQNSKNGKKPEKKE